MTRFKRFGALAGCAIALTGCMKPAGTAAAANPSTPPQVVVANSMIALGHAIGGALDGLKECARENKCSAADETAGEQVLQAIATAGKAIDAELASADPWTTQKQKIVAIITGSSVGQLKARVSPSTQLLIAAIVTLVDNVSVAVGGPTF